MRRLILAATAITALAFLGASVTTFPNLSAPRSTDPGAVLPVKGIGFEPGAPVTVCIANTDCAVSTVDAFGGFFQSRTTPDTTGFVVISAIQTFARSGRGIGGGRVVKAATITFVGDRPLTIGSRPRP